MQHCWNTTIDLTDATRASLRISKEEIEAAYKEVPEEDIEDIKKLLPTSRPLHRHNEKPWWN